ncbi:rhomboid family intramembrane serine protease [Nocardioides sp. CFH 31398]|uniref:rhomboid family intramembrane serine protease n=1 Tax=Nocardioides sp. CFH 31398 TaxID=2919579 RepID=UPI001F0682B5|nr:rhomboid family intramembrane serine protease [Nocardioides sp. CFH 31398]MCH1865675.1 rhomboid family intramembrane serine protease [Nocardioides sp. CFH 31398]
MRDASVGFQCPDCVKEGAKATRSGRTPYGGTRPGNPTATTATLIGINVAVWLALLVTGGRGGRLYELLALMPDGYCRSASTPSDYYPSITSSAACSRLNGDGDWIAGVADGAPWQLVTSMFTHLEWWHIAFNMLALWVLGPQLELALGRLRFLALYLLSGLAGSVAVLWLSDPTGATVGASTAVFGLFGALLVVGLKVGGDVRPILTLLGVNVLITVVGSSFISWQGHLGGLVGGALVAAVLVHAPRRRRTTYQAVGLVLVTALLVAATVVRVLLLR